MAITTKSSTSVNPLVDIVDLDVLNRRVMTTSFSEKPDYFKFSGRTRVIPAPTRARLKTSKPTT
jgi:hypothetical protein